MAPVARVDEADQALGPRRRRAPPIVAEGDGVDALLGRADLGGRLEPLGLVLVEGDDLLGLCVRDEFARRSP